MAVKNSKPVRAVRRRSRAAATPGAPASDPASVPPQQEPLKVAFLGPEGTFTQTAVLNHFGHSVRALPLASIDEVFHEVEAASADFGVVPIENSTEGTVNHTLDRFLTSPLKICGEVELRVRHHLMGAMSALARVERVCSHPQSL